MCTLFIKIMCFLSLSFFCYCYITAGRTKREVQNGTPLIQSLIDTSVGNAYKILWIMTEKPFISDNKISTNDEIMVIQNCNGNVLIRVNERVIAISQDIAEKIRVKKIAQGERRPS